MNNMKSVRNNALYIFLLLALVIFLVTTLLRNNQSLPTVDIGRVAQLAKEGRVEQITVSGQDLTVKLKDGDSVRSRKEDEGSLVETLRNLGVPELLSELLVPLHQLHRFLRMVDHVPLLAGREFTPQDTAAALKVAIVSERIVREYFPGGPSHALGRRVRLGDRGEWLTVVGVVADIRQMGLDREVQPMIYVPFQQERGGFVRFVSFVARTATPASVVEGIRAEIRRAARNQRDATVIRGNRLDDEARFPVGIGVQDERRLLVPAIARLSHRTFL